MGQPDDIEARRRVGRKLHWRIWRQVQSKCALNNESSLEAAMWRSSVEDNQRLKRLKRSLGKTENFVSVVTLILLAIYTFVTAGLWFAQLKANQVNSDAYIASNRPWVKVTVVPSEILWLSTTADSAGPTGSMSPRIYVENVGHAPAIEVKAIAMPYLIGSKQTVPDLQQALCPRSAKGGLIGSAPYGRILFPGDTVDASKWGLVEADFALDPAEIKKAEESSRGTPSTFNFMIVGCADYSFAPDQEHFQTYFSYEVWRTQKLAKAVRLPWGDVVTGQAVGFTVGQDVPAEDIGMYPSPNDNYAR